MYARARVRNLRLIKIDPRRIDWKLAFSFLFALARSFLLRHSDGFSPVITPDILGGAITQRARARAYLSGQKARANRPGR